ncbi:MAG: hypothetical protein IT317_04640 [Anaerolineales bacterium]|nr:hypothetical protein [Anaerolineales bacterium]
MSPAKTTAKPAAAKKSAGFTAEEKAAMKERARELKAEAAKADGESLALAAIAALQEPDRGLAKRLHALIKTHAPSLAAKTWYGMPAYANAEGKVVCFFQSAQKFGARYGTLGFNDAAHLDDGVLWPTAFALTALGPAEEAKIAALLKKAVG